MRSTFYLVSTVGGGTMLKWLACALLIEPVMPLQMASWTPSVNGEHAFVSFTHDMYKAMIGDRERTEAFEQAIARRLRDPHKTGGVVLDLGTGPFAVLALFAARAGARKVYAIEANTQAAAEARAAVARATDVAPGTIEVIEGFSTAITLPEKADLLVAEISGSIASEEGMYTSIQDARLRHMKRPHEASSYIPARCQTLVVPAACSLHHRTECDWVASGPPVRLACDSPWLLPLSSPQLWEDFAFGAPQAAVHPPIPGTFTSTLTFDVCAATVEDNRCRLAAQLEAHGVDPERAGARGRSLTKLVGDVATSLSGLACWPRLVLDEGSETELPIVIESRGPQGEARASHWQTVLPLLCTKPALLKVGDVISVSPTIEISAAIEQPPRYTIRARILRQE